MIFRRMSWDLPVDAMFKGLQYYVLFKYIHVWFKHKKSNSHTQINHIYNLINLKSDWLGISPNLLYSKSWNYNKMHIT